MNYEKSIDTGQADLATRDTIVETDLDDLDGSRAARRRRNIAIAAIVASAIIGLIAWKTFGGDAAADTSGAEQVPVVSVVVPGRETVESQITASGTLQARRPMPVGSVGEGGAVADVRVDAGDWVEAGQVLAVIDRSVQSQQTQAQAAQVEVARADARLAESNLQRALKLVDRGFISRADVDRLTATRDAAVSRVKVAQAQLGELQARTARLNIVAPAGGLVLERNVERGQVVGGGTAPLFVLARGGEMELAARVGEDELARLAVGVPAEVIPVGSDKPFKGQIWQLSPTIDEGSRQGLARIAMPYDRALRPGGFATARINAGSQTAPVLPESAIMSDAEGSFVYIVNDKNMVERRTVTLGIITAKGIVIAEGLNGTEKIVLRAGGFLSPEDKVKPRNAGPKA